MIDSLIKEFKKNKSTTAFIWQDITTSYEDLLERIHTTGKGLEKNIPQNSVVALVGDFSPNTVAILLNLIHRRNIIVPLTLPLKNTKKMDIAEVEFVVTVDVRTDDFTIEKTSRTSKNEYYKTLRSSDNSGLVLFTSGTSGDPKAAVHNFDKLFSSFKKTDKKFKTVNFLMFDHWGGLNTLFHTLFNCGVVLAVKDRSPSTVCQYIEQYDIDLLPVSPSFLNIMILSETYKEFDLSSLKIITYGSEPMPEFTLKRVKEIFPGIKLKQTYGLIELGVLSSKSKSDESLWMKLGGEGFKLRVVDEMLEIKSNTAMIGYINAESPFTEDGYFKTGDKVEVDGDYFKILGRTSEQINVGGEKVFPQEVENILLGYEYVLEALVFGVKHPIMGKVVHAKVELSKKVDEKTYTKELRRYCRDNLKNYMVPLKIEIVYEHLYGDRLKKKRSVSK